MSHQRVFKSTFSSSNNTIYDRSNCSTKHDRITTPSHSASRLIDDIMKKYFCQKAKQGSSCSLFSNRQTGSIYSTDKRLLYWERILKDREKIACRIQKVTGKRRSHVLYNQSESYRNVQNVKRVFDYAERLNPSKLSSRKVDHIHDPAVFETLPRSERLQTAASLHIVGMPKVSQYEQRIPGCSATNMSFLKSRFLRRRLWSKTADVTNVLDFYPDIDRLEIVGRRIHKHRQPFMDRISDFTLSTISSESELDQWEFPDFSIQINDMTLQTDKRSTQSMVLKLEFNCVAFERETQNLCQIKGLGRRPVQLMWKKIKPRGLSAFFFNRSAFRISYDEIENIQISFAPSERMICEEEWWLQTEPDFFESPSRVLVKLLGECYIPKKYFKSLIKDLLDSIICNILPGMGCQQRVAISDRDLFEKLNPGFKCEQSELREFNEIYRQVRKKWNAPLWNLELQTLKQLIEGVDNYTQRNIYLDDFLRINQEMRQRTAYCDPNMKHLLAKDLIISHLERWEVKAVQIVNSVSRNEIDALLLGMPFDFVIEQMKTCYTKTEKRRAFQENALYIQIYCSICDLAEDLVLFIENFLLYQY